MGCHRIFRVIIILLFSLNTTWADTFEECKNASDDTFVSSLESCQMYIYCNGDDSYSGECDEGQYFDGDACDAAENVYCPLDDQSETDPEEPSFTSTQTIATTTTTIITTLIPLTTTTSVGSSTSTSQPIVIVPVVRDQCPTTDDPDEIVLLANTQSCTIYYLCYHGHPIEMRCTDNLHFNIQTAKCDFAENVQCMIDRPNANKCLPNVTDFFPHPEKCNYFYYCIKGFLTVQQCPFYYGWDIDRRSCVFLGQAKCVEGSKRT